MDMRGIGGEKVNFRNPGEKVDRKVGGRNFHVPVWKIVFFKQGKQQSVWDPRGEEVMQPFITSSLIALVGRGAGRGRFESSMEQWKGLPWVTFVNGRA